MFGRTSRSSAILVLVSGHLSMDRELYDWRHRQSHKVAYGNTRCGRRPSRFLREEIDHVLIPNDSNI